MTHALGAAALAVIYVALFALGLGEDWRETPLLGSQWLVQGHLVAVVAGSLAALALMRPVPAISAHALLNTSIHAVGRWLSVVALAIMVALILLQIIMRLFFDAPNWTEEGARFLMLWMVGLMAPIAWRRGGFVAIDMLERALGRVLAAMLGLLLLGIALWVLIVMSDKGWNNHVDSMTGRGNSASLRLPFDLVGGDRIRFQNNWQYASLFTGTCLMIVVTVELILRRILSLFGGDDRIEPIAEAGQAGAE